MPGIDAEPPVEGELPSVWPGTMEEAVGTLEIVEAVLFTVMLMKEMLVL